MVIHFILWQSSYEKSLQYSRVIPRKNSKHIIQIFTLWR